VGTNEQRPDYDYADGVTFHVFELEDGATVSARVPGVKGDAAMTVEVSREGQQVRVQVQGTSQSWSVLLRGVASVRSVEGGIAQTDALGTLLIPGKGARSLDVRL
jgi:alpha-D-xyloside xylohydrolase